MSNHEVYSKIIDQLPSYSQKLQEEREILLADAVMIGEIPSPTFGEEERIRYISDRFTEAGLHNISIDEVGNCSAIYPGKRKEVNGKRPAILVAAHADTVFTKAVDYSLSVLQDRIVGPGIGDNSLGLAVLAALPRMLQKLEIALDCNIILLAASQSLGKGDLAGLRFFLDNCTENIIGGICVEGVHIGRLSYACLGMLRGEITCRVPAVSDWERYGGSGAIVAINRIISKILSIPVPSEPKTSVILGAVNAGTSFHSFPTSASLRFEVRSEQAGMVGSIERQILNIVEEMDAETGTESRLQVVARRQPGGISFSHPLVQSTRHILKALGVKPKIAPSVGELSALIAKGIPALTIGITTGENSHDYNETIHIEPIFKGLAQLVATLQIIDGGFENGED